MPENILTLWNRRSLGILVHFPLYPFLLPFTVWLYVICSMLSFATFLARFRKELEDLAR